MSAADQLAVTDDVRLEAFLPAAPVMANWRRLCRQYDADDGVSPRVAFSGSMTSQHLPLAWSSAHVLPDWADPHIAQLSQSHRQQLVTQLQVRAQPSLEVVTSHLSNLCAASCDARDLGERLQVLKLLFDFLQQQLTDQRQQQLSQHAAVVKVLRRTACVPVDGARHLVCATQTALNMTPSDEVRPYLYKVPPELGQYQAFFSTIGAEEVPSAAQFAHALQALKEYTKGRKLHPNELSLARTATRGCFEALQTRGDRTLLTWKGSLCLLSDACQLLESHRLVYNDAPSFYHRVPESSRLSFLLELRECGVRRQRLADDTVHLLPAHLRPTMLSSLVVESVLDTTARGTAGLAPLLQERLQSEHFRRGVVRLVKHQQRSQAATRLPDELIHDAAARLATLHIYSINNLSTHLLYKNKPIDASTTRKTCHMTSSSAPGGERRWEVYVEEAAALEHDLLIALAQAVNTVLGGLLTDAVLFVIPLLTSSPANMSSTLDKLNVAEDDSAAVSGERRLELYPALGGEVSEAHRRLLCEPHPQQALAPGEWAGFQADEHRPLVYCRVHEQVHGDVSENCYLVQCSDDDTVEIARASELFKFVSPTGDT